MSDNSRLIVKNLPSRITEKRLRDLFSPHGTVTDCQLKFDQSGKFRKFAFLGFLNNSEATDAKDYFNNTFIDTSKIQVEFCRKIGEHGSKNRNQPKIEADDSSKKKTSKSLVVEIRGFASGTKKKSLLQFFAPSKPKGIRLTKDDTSDSSALVYLTKQSDVGQLLKKNGKFFGGCKVTVVTVSSDDQRLKRKDVDDSTIDEKPERAKQQTADECVEEISETGRLFVRNLPFVCTVEEIENLFKPYGPLTDVKLPMARSFVTNDDGGKKSKGIALVTFVFPEHALKAYGELDGSTYKGRMLHIIAGHSADEGKSSKKGVSEKSAFKDKKAAKLKSSSLQSHIWNSLFVDPNAAADILTARLETEKSKLLDAKGRGSSLGVRMALGETQIVKETREFLLQHGVCLDSFSRPDAPRSKLVILVKNLPAKTTADELREKFEKFGTLARVVLPPSGITALAEYLDEQQAKKAFTALAYSRFKTAPLYLEWAPGDVFTGPGVVPEEKEALPVEPRPLEETALVPDDDGATLFVKNLNFETVDETLKDHFSKIGPLVYASVAKKRSTTGLLSMGFGFVRFVRSSDATRALKELQGRELDGFALQLKLSDRQLESDPQRSKRRRSPSTNDPANKIPRNSNTKILIRNIPFQANEKEVESLFKTFGDLHFVRIPKKPGGDGHRGFCFVDFVSDSDAKKAFDALCHSTHLYGRRLVMEWATTGDDTVEELQKKVAAQVTKTPGRKKITRKEKIVEEKL